jgi:hypothetical protein
MKNRERANYKLERWKGGKDGDWYWRQTDKRNGKIVGGSTEGYWKAEDCLANLYVVTGWATFDEDEG